MKDENNTKLKRYFKEIENWSTLFQNNVLLLTSPSFSIFKLNIVSTPRSIFVYSEIDENNTHRKTIIA
jgi:deoxyadenosine/deoxycytidine kinase